MHNEKVRGRDACSPFPIMVDMFTSLAVIWLEEIVVEANLV